MRTSFGLCLFVLAMMLTACGTVWTIGFAGATLSVQIPYRPAPLLSGQVATMPATSPETRP